MAEIIETQKLPVTITKVKIGKNNLTKSIIDQIPLSRVITHIRENGLECYGLPVKDPTELHYYDQDVQWDFPYTINGEIIGYVTKDKIFSPKDIYRTLLNNKNYISIGLDDFDLENHSDNWSLVLFHSDGKLRKGLLDSWTKKQLGLELEHIII